MRPPGPLLLLLAAAAAATADDCREICSCKWKNGKQTAECRQKQLHTLPNDLSVGTQVLDLSYNLIQRLPRRAFAEKGLTNLQKIFLRTCQLAEIDNEALAELSNLVELDLSKNRLRTIPSPSFKHTPSLRELWLAHNPIQVILADAFIHLTSLRTLDLSHCIIRDIVAHAFQPLEKLEKLKLAFNRLTELRPRLVESLRNLHEVTVHNNPWNCDCRLRKLREWLVEKNVPHEVSPVCAKPDRIQNRTFDEMGEHEFACPPEILPNVSHTVRGTAGGNVTAWCPVGGLPTPRVLWFVRDVLVHNESLLGEGGARVFIANMNEGERGSLLLLSGVRVEDSGVTIRCDATNAAGTDSAAFRLVVSPGSSLGFSMDKVAAVSSVAVVVVLILVGVLSVVAHRRRANSAVPVKTITVNGATETRLANLPYTPSAYVGGSVVYTKDNSNLLCEKDHSSDGEAAECCTTDEESQHSLCSVGPRLGGHSRSLDGDKATLGCPFDAMWEPERVQAMLDSAAPENVMHSSLHEPLGPNCNAMVQQRLMSSSQRHLNNRLSYLPDFAPDYSALYTFSQVGSGPAYATSTSTSHYGTIPRSVKVRSCVPEVIPGDGTPPMNHQSRAWYFGSGSASLSSSQERRGSGTLLLSGQAPNPTSACLPPQPLHGHGNKLSRITARDSPDEGYQEGADV
ncbi:leucine-rich repeat-containing protein 24-like [Portunus trituberculatus]|uniref:leucine-rich repeat-containing protein 24-like n=1 Tax=Portunus trituberculatus TaxID=210409 RepID=UPI001E1D0F6D|nr:leucine-rich repeat-containing protein 24-like [Portunus trituberculatus]